MKGHPSFANYIARKNASPPMSLQTDEMNDSQCPKSTIPKEESSTERARTIIMGSIVKRSKQPINSCRTAKDGVFDK